MKKFTITYEIPSGQQYNTIIKAKNESDARNKFFNRYFACGITNVKSQPAKIGFMKKIREFFFCPFYF